MAKFDEKSKIPGIGLRCHIRTSARPGHPLLVLMMLTVLLGIMTEGALAECTCSGYYSASTSYVPPNYNVYPGHDSSATYDFNALTLDSSTLDETDCAGKTCSAEIVEHLNFKVSQASVIDTHAYIGLPTGPVTDGSAKEFTVDPAEAVWSANNLYNIVVSQKMRFTINDGTSDTDQGTVDYEYIGATVTFKECVTGFTVGGIPAEWTQTDGYLQYNSAIKSPTSTDYQLSQVVYTATKDATCSSFVASADNTINEFDLDPKNDD